MATTRSSSERTSSSSTTSREEPLFTRYTFASTDDYLAAANGVDPFAYQTVSQPLGDPTLNINSAFYGFFFQDDWQVSSNGSRCSTALRYDLFDVPEAVPFRAQSRLEPSSTDRQEQLGASPRHLVGLSPVKDETVLSAHTGVMYDSPLIRFYRRRDTCKTVRSSQFSDVHDLDPETIRVRPRIRASLVSRARHYLFHPVHHPHRFARFQSTTIRGRAPSSATRAPARTCRSSSLT